MVGSLVIIACHHHQVLLTTVTDLSVMLKVGLVSEAARLTSDQ